MNMSTIDLQDTTEWLVSATDTSVIISAEEADVNATVDEYTQQVMKRFQYVNLAVRLTMGLIAFSTNLLTIVAIASFEYLRSCTNYLIAYLAFADMIAGITSMFLVANYLIPMSNRLWIMMCAVEQSIGFTSAGFNIVAILGISLDRLIFVTFPLRYHLIVTNRITVIYIVLCVALMVGIVAGSHCCGYTYISGRICSGKVFGDSRHINIFFYIFSIFIILPNIRIAYIAYKQSKAIGLGQMSAVSTNQNKITKMLSMVLGVYYACYVPQIAFAIILGFFPLPKYGVLIDRVTSWIWWVNSWSNPPIYAWKNKAFNKAFRSLLGLKSARVDPMLD